MSENLLKFKLSNFEVFAVNKWDENSKKKNNK